MAENEPRQVCCVFIAREPWFGIVSGPEVDESLERGKNNLKQDLDLLIDDNQVIMQEVDQWSLPFLVYV